MLICVRSISYFNGHSQSHSLEELDRKHFAKGHHSLQKKAPEEISRQVSLSKNVALAEVKIQRLCQLLHEVD